MFLAQGNWPFLTLKGIPLVLCDEEGISSLVSSFAIVEAGSLGFVVEGKLMIVQLTAWVFSWPDVSPSVTFVIGGSNYLVRVITMPHSRQVALGQRPIVREEDDELGQGVCGTPSVSCSIFKPPAPFSGPNGLGRPTGYPSQLGLNWMGSFSCWCMGQVLDQETCVPRSV